MVPEPADKMTLLTEEEAKKAEEEQAKLDVEWKKEVKEWKQGEAISKQQIASSIPDSLFMEVRAKGTAYKIWADLELEKHFEKRSRMVLIDLRRWLQELRCPNKESIIDHFATLRTMREDLASMGELLTENDYAAIIMGSLPSSYDPSSANPGHSTSAKLLFNLFYFLLFFTTLRASKSSQVDDKVK